MKIDQQTQYSWKLLKNKMKESVRIHPLAILRLGNLLRSLSRAMMMWDKNNSQCSLFARWTKFLNFISLTSGSSLMKF